MLTLLPVAPTTTAGADLGTDPLTAHTDGGCSPNPGMGSWAVIFSRDGEVLCEHCGTQADTTSQTMELTAIHRAILLAPRNVPLLIVTDSSACIGWLEKGWKRKAPHLAAISAEIDQLRRERSAPVSFRQVRGHGSEVLNVRADELVNEARAARRA
jgi:ribonuclease HI